MTTIAFIADSHFDSSPGGRFEECCRLHDWIASDLAERRPNLILHGGDLYERRSTAVERTAAAAWLQRCAEVAPVVIVRGNHDQPGDIELLARLVTGLERCDGNDAGEVLVAVGEVVDEVSDGCEPQLLELGEEAFRAREVVKRS